MKTIQANDPAVAMTSSKRFQECVARAAKGDADAQLDLAIYYAEGDGVEQNPAEAVKWFRNAADHGEIGAFWNLGMHYINGIGVAKDKVEGAKWFHSGAELDDAYCQFCLGECFQKGIGVTKNYVEAFAWLNLAATSSNRSGSIAGKQRDKLKKRMSQKQVLAGQKRTEEIRATIDAKLKRRKARGMKLSK